MLFAFAASGVLVQVRDDEDVIRGGNSTTSIFHGTNWMLELSCS